MAADDVTVLGPPDPQRRGGPVRRATPRTGALPPGPAAVATSGPRHRYLLFAGEGHGFRLRDSVSRSLLAEAELYSHTMGITVTLDR